MKKRIVNALVTGLMVVSLAGCGTKTEVTGQEIPESGSAVESEAEADGSVADESTSEEVIGDNADEPSDFAGAENESIVLYAEIAEYGEYVPMHEMSFESVSNTFTANKDLPVYSVDGIECGYIKKGSTITFTGYASNAWARFENPIAGTDYDYLYGFKEYADVPNTNQITITPSDLKQRIIDNLAILEEPTRVVIDTPTDDMDVYEFRMDYTYDDELDYTFWYEKNLKSDTRIFYDYMTYFVECEEDTDGWIICKIYYKDLIDRQY